MTEYFTSDLHLAHVNIIKYTKSRAHYKDVDEMTLDIINKFNARVKPTDWVYFNGDICMGQRDKHRYLVSQLNGYKILVYGNHDYYKVRDPGAKEKRDQRHDEIVDRWLNLGMNEVYKELYIKSPKYGMIYMRHEPKLDFDGDWHLCGHVHESWSRSTNIKHGDPNGRIINVGVDVSDLEPKTLDELFDRPYVEGPPHRTDY